MRGSEGLGVSCTFSIFLSHLQQNIAYKHSHPKCTAAAGARLQTVIQAVAWQHAPVRLCVVLDGKT